MDEEEATGSCSWSWEQDKAFENALATVEEDSVGRWERIAAAVPEKTVEDIKRHYEILVEDVNNIESGLVTLPNYASSVENSGEQGSEGSAGGGSSGGSGKKGGNSGNLHADSSHSLKASRSDQERRKGIAWTEDEHRLFLLGLEKYGKGDWRSISRNFVISRTPTQVASHAQKYFIRLNSMNKDRRRSSIHDITSVGGEGGEVSTSQAPITGQTNGQRAAAASGKPTKPTSQPSPSQPPPPSPPGPPVASIGRPVAAPLVTAAPAPANLPAPSAPQASFGVRASSPRMGISPKRRASAHQ